MSYSSLCPIEAAVPQSSFLGPKLFNIYINDIPSVENDCNVVISVYADYLNISIRSGCIDIAVRKLNSVIGQSDRISVTTTKIPGLMFVINLYFSTTCFGLTRTIIRKFYMSTIVIELLIWIHIREHRSSIVL
jgi:predicted phage tail protein